MCVPSVSTPRVCVLVLGLLVSAGCKDKASDSAAPSQCTQAYNNALLVVSRGLNGAGRSRLPSTILAEGESILKGLREQKDEAIGLCDTGNS